MSVFSPKRRRKHRSIVKLNTLYSWSRIFLRALNGRALAHIIRMRLMKIFDALLLICNVYTHCIQIPMNLYTRCVQCTHTPYAKILTISERKFDRLHRPMHRPASSNSSLLSFKKLAGNGTAFCLITIFICLGDKAKSRTVTSEWIQNRRKNREFLQCTSQQKPGKIRFTLACSRP